MNDPQDTCVAKYMLMLDMCNASSGISMNEMGSAFLPSLAESGCPNGDGGMLNSVDMFVRAGENIGSLQCAQRAAQMLCGVEDTGNADVATSEKGSITFDSLEPSGDPNSDSALLKCFCLAQQQCASIVASHY